MKTVCATDRCNGCMLCKAVCPRDAILVDTDWRACNARIDEAKCVECGLCERLCPRNRPVPLSPPLEWHQGWANDSGLRSRCSSGGLATALALRFVRDGGVCVGCVFRDGRFVFGRAGTPEEVLAFRGSKYVKSDPSDVHGLVVEALSRGRKVLFFGLPCQVAGLLAHPALARLDRNGLCTVDLICHGSPSPKLLDAFLAERRLTLAATSEITFRDKTAYRIRTDGHLTSKSSGRDLYMAAFMKLMTFTDNCYECPYARLERCSDLTLGDSWGSELPRAEYLRGISLVLCQTAKGAELLRRSDVHLEDVDLEKAIAGNTNLARPSPVPPQRERFFRILVRTGSFGAAMRRTLPKLYFKTMLKAWLGI